MWRPLYALLSKFRTGETGARTSSLTTAGSSLQWRELKNSRQIPSSEASTYYNSHFLEAISLRQRWDFSFPIIFFYLLTYPVNQKSCLIGKEIIRFSWSFSAWNNYIYTRRRFTKFHTLCSNVPLTTDGPCYFVRIQIQKILPNPAQWWDIPSAWAAFRVETYEFSWKHCPTSSTLVTERVR